MATKLQILQDHCREFEDQLERCDSEEQALRLQEQICTELGESCKSEMMQELLAEHAGQLIQQRFTSIEG